MPREVCDAFAANGIEAVLHYSRRSARAFLEAARAEGVEISALAVPHCCLSPKIAAILREAGAQVFSAASADEKALFAALERALRSQWRKRAPPNSGKLLISLNRQGTAGMADDELKDAGGPEPGRPKREPPTIDLEASEVSSETRAAARRRRKRASEAHPDRRSLSRLRRRRPNRSSPWVIAPFSGAVAAALVIGVGWMLGWPPVQAPPAAPQVTAGAFDDLGKRVAGLEAKPASRLRP